VSLTGFLHEAIQNQSQILLIFSSSLLNNGLANSFSVLIPMARQGYQRSRYLPSEVFESEHYHLHFQFGPLSIRSIFPSFQYALTDFLCSASSVTSDNAYRALIRTYGFSIFGG